MPVADEVGRATSLTTAGAPYELSIAVRADAPTSLRCVVDPSGLPAMRRAVDGPSPELTELLDVALPPGSAPQAGASFTSWLGMATGPGEPGRIAALKAYVCTDVAAGVIDRVRRRWPALGTLMDLVPAAMAPPLSVDLQVSPQRPSTVGTHRPVEPGYEHQALDALLVAAGGAGLARRFGDDLRALGLARRLWAGPVVLSAGVPVDLTGRPAGPTRVGADCSVIDLDADAARDLACRAVAAIGAGESADRHLAALAATGDRWRPSWLGAEASADGQVDRVVVYLAPTRP